MSNTINLTKDKSVILLTKESGVSGELLINLNWTKNSGKKGFLSGLLAGNKNIDLDVGCLYELADGKTGCIQALGNAFGDLNNAPYIALDSDDRTGESVDGENLRVNLNHLGKIKRIIVYAFIYEGAPNWSATNGVVTIKNKNSEDLVVHLTSNNSGQGMCGIALIENENGQLKVKNVENYFAGHQELDRHFGFGLKWVSGSK